MHGPLEEILKILGEIDGEKREEVFSELQRHYCFLGGRKQTTARSCQCWNDE